VLEVVQPLGEMGDEQVACRLGFVCFEPMLFGCLMLVASLVRREVGVGGRLCVEPHAVVEHVGELAINIPCAVFPLLPVLLEFDFILELLAGVVQPDVSQFRHLQGFWFRVELLVDFNRLLVKGLLELLFEEFLHFGTARDNRLLVESFHLAAVLDPLPGL